MLSPADFSDLFDDCRTHRAAQDAYHEGIKILQEALRLAHVRVVTLRDAPAGASLIPSPQNATEMAEKAVQRSHDAAVRRWATQEGIPFRRVSKKLRQQYDEAHHD